MSTQLLLLETPETIDDVSKIIKYASELRPRPLIRVVGSQHSAEEAIHGRRASEGAVLCISMTKFDGIALVRDERRSKTVDRPHAHVRVEAGVHFAESPYIHPVPGPRSQLHDWLARHDLALPAVGGVVHQTVVGFLATGSAGGSKDHCLHDAIVEIELVDGRGCHHVLRRGDEHFSAAGVSLGLLGVIISVTLELEPSFQVTGTEHFGSWARPADQRGPDTREYLFNHEYARMIWWPQTDQVQYWSCQRVAPRADFRPNPYIPMGLRELEGQVVASVLLTLSGNLESLEHLRSVSDKFRQTRLREYMDLVEQQTRARTLNPHDGVAPVLSRRPHFHWSRSRFRSRRAGATAEALADMSINQFGSLLTAVQKSPAASYQRFINRLAIAAGDEVVKRLLYLSENHAIDDPALRRRQLDEYGDFVSGMFATDRDVGPIGVGEPVWQAMQGLWNGITGEPMEIVEIADCIGEWMAARLVPIADETPSETLARMLLAVIRVIVYEAMPTIISGFFEAFADTTTGFCDHDFPGLAVDRRINHHLIQTKFSELWVRAEQADLAITRLTRYFCAARDLDADTDDDRTAWLQANLAELANLADMAELADMADVPASNPLSRFRRRGNYSMELYPGRASEQFLLYPGSSADTETHWVRLNFFWWAYNGGGQRDFFAGLWKLFEADEDHPAIEYRFHWGKEVPTGGGADNCDAEFRRNVAAFLSSREALDPTGVFYTKYWRDILEALAER